MGTTYRIDPPEPLIVLTPPTPVTGQNPPSTPSVPVKPIPTVGTSTATAAPNLWWVGGGFVLLLAAWWVATNLIHDPAYATTKRATTTVAGVTIFAVFFVAATALERLLEPIAMVLNPGPESDLQQAESDVAKTKQAAVEEHAALIAAQLTSPPQSTPAPQPRRDDLQTALDAAAGAKAKASQWKLNRKVLFWALASALSVIASSAMKLYFLTAVGIANPPRTLELLATGLIIGGGTKPLHDLVTLISAKADVANNQSTGSAKAA
jgi:hypothetical protein